MKLGTESGRVRSNSRTFFSLPAVSKWDAEGESATVRTIWLCGKECSTAPEYVSQTFLKYIVGES